MVAKLPKEVGAAVEKVGQMRSLAKSSEHEAGDEDELNDELTVSSPNRPVPQRSDTETAVESTRRRMKWVAQISEYWSLTRLANLTDEDMADVLNGNIVSKSASTSSRNDLKSESTVSQHSLILSTPPRLGRILLVGSGPGHPSLLTLATHTALTKHADLVLTDKLVPPAVLALIPKHVEVRVARKFPGNAEGAQTEMMEAAVEAAKAGKTVVRVSGPFPKDQ